jgi:xanthine dehydrogenase molybdopterin-binding subunit B
MKRMGGAFGGKRKLNPLFRVPPQLQRRYQVVPVQLTLSCDVDMKITGTRHVFLSRITQSAQMTEGPKLLAFDVKIYANLDQLI